jgi:hypothetical protein
LRGPPPPPLLLPPSAFPLRSPLHTMPATAALPGVVACAPRAAAAPRALPAAAAPFRVLRSASRAAPARLARCVSLTCRRRRRDSSVKPPPRRRRDARRGSRRAAAPGCPRRQLQCALFGVGADSAPRPPAQPGRPRGRERVRGGHRRACPAWQGCDTRALVQHAAASPTAFRRKVPADLTSAAAPARAQPPPAPSPRSRLASTVRPPIPPVRRAARMCAARRPPRRPQRGGRALRLDSTAAPAARDSR